MNISRHRAATRLMIDIKHQPDSLAIWLTSDIKRQPDQFWLMFDEKCFFHTSGTDKVQSKSAKIVYLLWNLHIMKCKENI